MIQITPQMRILVAIEAVDGRRGIDALAQVCREKLNSDPFSGWLFIFRNRSARRSGSWPTTARDSGSRPSACREDVFAGGRRALKRVEPCARIRRKCCWRAAIRKPKPRRCGGV